MMLTLQYYSSNSFQEVNPVPVQCSLRPRLLVSAFLPLPPPPYHYSFLPPPPPLPFFSIQINFPSPFLPYNILPLTPFHIPLTNFNWPSPLPSPIPAPPKPSLLYCHLCSILNKIRILNYILLTRMQTESLEISSLENIEHTQNRKIKQPSKDLPTRFVL